MLDLLRAACRPPVELPSDAILLIWMLVRLPRRPSAPWTLCLESRRPGVGGAEGVREPSGSLLRRGGPRFGFTGGAAGAGGSVSSALLLLSSPWAAGASSLQSPMSRANRLSTLAAAKMAVCSCSTATSAGSLSSSPGEIDGTFATGHEPCENFDMGRAAAHAAVACAASLATSRSRAVFTKAAMAILATRRTSSSPHLSSGSVLLRARSTRLGETTPRSFAAATRVSGFACSSNLAALSMTVRLPSLMISSTFFAASSTSVFSGNS
mmetsp:Transcript_17531/g.45132  ORF Transcript_17531/g.45132 Transcript_17531/m.45132 type:complete len:267 (-) Transcript_17531:373-1173(-)